MGASFSFLFCYQLARILLDELWSLYLHSLAIFSKGLRNLKVQTRKAFTMVLSSALSVTLYGQYEESVHGSRRVYFSDDSSCKVSADIVLYFLVFSLHY